MSTLIKQPYVPTPRFPAGPTAATLPIPDHSNDSLILRLHMTINHLSRWLTPITDPMPIEQSVRRGEPSVLDLLQRMRDEELVVFAYMHAIVNEINPDLDRIPDPLTTPQRLSSALDKSWISVLADFRRLRQSTCSLLRALPDNAWKRVGTSRIEHDWQVRTLAERLVQHDLDCLYQIDLALDRSGARESISSAAGVHLDEILRLIPVQPR
ncbi:MAG: hypothetical protein KF883_13390 [Thermomicrobiales bacterium]|nr:hypothetical protein [Thermomicrobiales bacterium]